MSRRILLTTHAYAPEIGGTELYTEHVAKALAQRGWEPTVYAQMPRLRWVPDSVEDGIPVRRFWTPPVIGRLRGLLPAKRFRTNRRWSPTMLPPGLYRDFDVIYAIRENTFPTDTLLWHRHHGRLPVPLVFFPTGRSGMYPTPAKPDPYYTEFLPRVLQGPELLHTVTHAETAEFAGLGFPRGRIREIPEGLFASEFRVQPDGEAFRARHDLRGPFVLFVGGLFFNKRLDVLLDAFRILEAEFPRLQLVCIGKSGDALGASWRARAERELGPRKHSEKTDPRAELLHAYAAADVFSLPSEFEGYGIVTIEAMACGTPFVNCATGNAPELAALGFGRVAAVGDAKGLAGHLRDYLADPQATRRAGAMARTYAMERLDWGALAPRFAAMFEEAIAIGARR